MDIEQEKMADILEDQMEILYGVLWRKRKRSLLAWKWTKMLIDRLLRVEWLISSSDVNASKYAFAQKILAFCLSTDAHSDW